MNYKNSSRAGFTLVEIMIVVALIGMLAAMAIPGFVKARKQAQGRRIVNDARQMDGAVDQWALEVNAVDGQAINTTQAASYLKGTAWKTNDVLGYAYVIGNVGTNQIRVATNTKSALAGVGVDWGMF